MEQVKVEKTQNRLARELDTRAEMQRPTSWQAPETLPSPNPRPGNFSPLGKNQYGRTI